MTRSTNVENSRARHCPSCPDSPNEADQPMFRKVFEYSLDAIFFVDANDGEILRANPSAQRLLGYKPEHLKGRHYKTLFPHPEIEETAETILEGTSFADTAFLSLECRHARGHAVRVDLSASLLQWNGGEKAILLTLRDAQENHSIREHLNETLDLLRRRGAELETFARTISHDLRSPLVTIDSYLQIIDMEAGEDAGGIKKDLRSAREAVAKMEELLRGLLNLAREGKRIGELQPCNTLEIVEYARQLLQGKIRFYKARLEISRDLPVVWGDPLRLLQVMQNLLENAMKFHQAEVEPKIEIMTCATEHGRTLGIRDNGAGIEPEDLESIFQDHKRLDDTTPGTGLGLGMVQGIVEQHGGKIWAESKGKKAGTTFYLYIPEVKL